MLELKCFRERLRAHPIKGRYILSGNRPILHIMSEDILTANVFGILKNINPRVWLPPFLGNACGFTVTEFPRLYEDDDFSTFSVSLWHELDPPPRKLEGPTQADVLIELKNAIIIIECKGQAPLQKSVSTDKLNFNNRFLWDQAIRNIVRGYTYTRKHFEGKDFFFIVLSMNKKEEIFGQYEDWHRIRDQVENRILLDAALREFFPESSINEVCMKLSSHIRWSKWSNLGQTLENLAFEDGYFCSQNRFCRDLVEYITMKVELKTRTKSRKSE